MKFRYLKSLTGGGKKLLVNDILVKKGVIIV